MFLFLIWNLVKHETAAFFSMLFRQGLLLFFSPRKRSWFQVSPWLTEIWKCLRFSGTSGTGTSCDLRFNKWFWSIRWVCLHNLTSVFLIARWLFYLTVCSLRDEEEETARYGEKNLFAAQSGSRTVLIWTLLRGKVINESDLHPFILTFLNVDWSRVQSFLVWSLFREESSSSKTDIFDLLHSVTTRVFWQLASMSEFSKSSEFTRVSEDVCVCFCSVFQTLDWARMQCWGT